MSQLTVELKIRKVPVPPAELAVWKLSVSRLYDRLEQLVLEDERREHELDSFEKNIDSCFDERRV